jgi:radical SAM superfamily enzyme YgiQ (UPF0313 family)
MRILLLNPRDLTYKPRGGAFARSVSYPAVTLTTLAALVPGELGAAIRILDEGVDETPVDFGVDVLGITVVTATARRAYAVADEARARGVHVVLGGYHPTACPREAIAHADTVITGYAETAWPQFLRDFAAGRPGALYAGQDAPALSGLPWPRRDLLKRGAYMKVDAVMAARGCPNRCRFCAVSGFSSGAVSRRDPSDVVAEIRALRSRTVLFLDPNFHADPAYSLALMEELKPLGVRWGCLSTVAVGEDPVLLEAMRSSGCIGALVGFESVCQASLDGVAKRHNDVGRYEQSVRGFREHGLAVFGCFVFGFEQDEAAIFDETVEFVDRTGIDLVRFAVLTPFPGTPMFRALDEAGRIVERDTDLYDFQHVVFEPARMSVAQLQNGLRRAWRAAYSPGRILGRVAKSRANRLLTLTANLAFTRYYKRLLSVGSSG